MNKFMFFNFKKSLFLNLLITTAIILWITLCTQLLSLIDFKENFTDSYMRYFPINDGYVISLNLFQIKNIENKEIKIKEVINYIKNNKNISYLFVKKEFIPDTQIEINAAKYRRYYKAGAELDDHVVYLVKMNYGYIEYLQKYINVEIQENQWNIKSNEIPVILGNNYSRDFKIGDIIKYNDKNLKVIAIFKESVMYSSGSNPVDYSEYLDDALVIPIELTKDTFNFAPISVISRTYADKAQIINCISDLKKIDKNIEITTYGEILNNFIDKVDNARKDEIFQTIIISFLALMIINNTILFKIHNNKEKIGVAYCVGASKRFMAYTIFKEFIFLVFVSMLISIPITYKLTSFSIYFFYNENRGSTLAIAIISLLILVMISTIISLRTLNKLTLKELIGGFKE